MRKRDQTPGPAARGFSFALEELDGVLQLRALHWPGNQALRLAWNSAEMRRRMDAGRKQILGRALGLHRHPALSVLDATAGLCRDALSIASLGTRVIALERHPLLHAMHRHEWLRLLAGPQEARLHAALNNLDLHHGDACLRVAGLAADVIYLDPMYPKARRHALGGLEMQYLDALLGPADDPAQLLAAALAGSARRGGVKRPRRAAPISGPAPSLQMKGNQTRFDIYLLQPD